MRELDLILLPYAEQVFPGLDNAQRAGYRALLEEEDQDLYRWLIGSDLPLDPLLAATVSKVLDFNKGTRSV